MQKSDDVPFVVLGNRRPTTLRYLWKYSSLVLSQVVKLDLYVLQNKELIVSSMNIFKVESEMRRSGAAL